MFPAPLSGLDISTMAAAGVRKQLAAALGLRGLHEPHVPSFREFLDNVTILSDDPRAPLPVKWQPWPHLLERAEAWSSGKSEVVLKARQLGISNLAAAHDLWDAMYHGWDIAVISKGLREAREQLARSRYIWSHLPYALKRQAIWRSDDVRFPAGGGRILTLPSTEDAGVGFTFQRIRFDELAFHPFGGPNYAAVQPAISAGGQFVAHTTANPQLGASGIFYDLYTGSKKRETPYAPVFIPWDARPGRDEAWLSRQRAAYAGFSEEADAYYPATDAEAFVGRSGLVYGMFSEVRHVKEAPCPWESCRLRMAGVDWGGGDPTAIVLLGRAPSGAIHQYGEFYDRGAVSILDLAAFLIEWDLRGRIADVECDPSQANSIATLNLNALKGRVFAGDNKRGDGLGLTADLLDQGRLTIGPTCVNSIAEFPVYRWLNRTDPNDKMRYATSTPAWTHGDAMDARRLALKKLLRYETTAMTELVTYRRSGRAGVGAGRKRGWV